METDLETLATYPMESDDWLLTVAIGGIALLLSFFIVPLFLVAGYSVRAIRAGMDGAAEPPVFDDWGTMLKEGVVVTIIGVIYQIIPLIVFVVFVGGSMLAFFTGTDAGAGLGLVGLLGGLFVSWLLSIVFGYVGLAGIANYARRGTFGSAFDFGVIRDAVTSREYLFAWLYVIALNVVVGVVTGVLNVIPIVGGIVGLFVGFYALLIACWLWGDGFAAATDGAPAAATEPGTAAV